MVLESLKNRKKVLDKPLILIPDPPRSLTSERTPIVVRPVIGEKLRIKVLQWIANRKTIVDRPRLIGTRPATEGRISQIVVNRPFAK